MNISSFVTILFLFQLLTSYAHGQEADLTLMTPDSGVIRVNWGHQFEWNERGDLILKLTPPQNIEIQGFRPHYGARGREYQILIKDLFIKEKILMRGEGGKVLSTQTLMININDHQKGVIKADPACPTNVHGPLFSRTILFIKCREIGKFFLVTERGHINGHPYHNEYRLKSTGKISAQAIAKDRLTRQEKLKRQDQEKGRDLGWPKRSLYLQLEQRLVDQNEVSAGDGQIFLASVSADFAWEDLWLTPALKLTLFSLLSNTDSRPFVGRQDEASVRVRHHSWKNMTLTPSVVTKLLGRGHQDHYLAALTVGGGLAYQFAQLPRFQTYLDFFPGAGGREYRAFETGIRYQNRHLEYGLAFSGERYSSGREKKTKSFGVVLNVTKGF